MSNWICIHERDKGVIYETDFMAAVCSCPVLCPLYLVFGIHKALLFK